MFFSPLVGVSCLLENEQHVHLVLRTETQPDLRRRYSPLSDGAEDGGGFGAQTAHSTGEADARFGFQMADSHFIFSECAAI